MNDQFQRTRMLIGQENLDKLAAAKVLVFGVGGVGGYVCEALCRAGVGRIDIVDRDIVDVTNINRQIIATHDTVGKPKVEVCRQRMLSINPDIKVSARQCFYLPDRADEFDFAAYDYIVDAIDTVTGKIALVVNANAAGTPIISSMGAGNKLDPTQFRISDIFSTDTDPLSRVMRRELKKRGIKKLKVVWSPEKPITPIKTMEEDNSKRRSTPGSVAFVPSVSGLIMAGEIIRTLAQGEA